MNDNYRKLFQKLAPDAPPDALRFRILTNIERLEKRTLFMRRMVFGAGAFISLAGLYPSFSYALSELTQSSFWQYFSLLSSDGDLALSNSNQFFYSLAESFPIVGGTLILSCFLLFFIALDRLMRLDALHPGHYSSHRFI